MSESTPVTDDERQERRRAARNRFVVWLVLIGGAAVVAARRGGGWQVVWLLFGWFVFSELYGLWYFLEDAVRTQGRQR